MARPKKNVVQLSDAEVKRLNALRKKQGTSQTIADRCNILLAVDENHLPTKTYDQCMVSCGVSRATIASTIKNVRRERVGRDTQSQAKPKLRQCATEGGWPCRGKNSPNGMWASS